MQINTPKSFNKQTIEDAKLAEAIGPFIDYCNQNFDQFGRGLANQLTFPDNFKGEIQTIDIKHNQPVNVTAKGSVSYAFPIGSFGDGVRAFKFQANNDGSLAITCWFQSPIPVLAKAQTSATGNFAKYQCSNIGGIAAGDRVLITAFGNKSNNVDSGLVAWVATETSGPVITVYNGNTLAAETLSEFRGASEVSKKVTLLLLYA
jgi:hypothetical protein